MIDDEPVADLVRRWQPGWGACRGLPPAVDSGSSLRVTIAARSRHEEVFALTADERPETLVDLAAVVRDAGRLTWLTVFTRRPDDARRSIAATGLEVIGVAETFMTIALSDQPRHRPAPPYTVALGRVGEVWHARVAAEDGTTAASGLMGVTDGGAVAHEIRTDVDHRRRGLGSVVMSALVDSAMTTGATTGLLVASPDGRRLYERLGWTARATVLTARPV